MPDKRKKTNFAPFIPLLAMPLFLPLLLGRPHLSSSYMPSAYQPFRTEAEQQQLIRDDLRNTINRYGLTYRQFSDIYNFERTLPSTYDGWKVSVYVTNNQITSGLQSIFDLDMDGLGRGVRIDLSKKDAESFISKYRDLMSQSRDR